MRAIDTSESGGDVAPVTQVDLADQRASDTAAELSVRVVRMVLLEFQRRFGRERLEALFNREQLSVPLEYLEASENFVSMRFVERLQDLVLAESEDPDFVKRAGALSMTPEALGFVFYLMKAFGSPSIGFKKMVEYAPAYNRVGAFSIQDFGRNQMTLRYESRVPERNRNFCEGRIAQFTALPTIWGVPAARVSENQCQVHGAAFCQYQIEWVNPRRAWRRMVGLAIAAGVTSLGGHFLGLSLLQLTLLGGATGFFAGAWLDASRDIRRKDELLQSQNQGLLSSFQDLQRRHEELNTANRELNRINVELESRVEARTHDLTEANTKLAAALEKQQELDRQKTEFFDNVSHELRTPLTIILLSLESLLLRDGLAPAIREHLQAMDRSATKLIRLINNLLDLAKMEAGRKRIAYQPAEMHAFLRTLISPFKVVAKEKRLGLELEGSPGPAVFVDPEMMDVVFQNLVGNALKFTSKGGVTVRVSDDDRSCTVEVSDTGPGMAAADLPLIFNRFAQADSQGLRRFGGTGIGLALVKEIVELHGGRIEVTSELNVGSTFRVILPKGEAHIREDLRERRQTEIPVRRDRRAGTDALAALRSISPNPSASEPSGEGDGRTLEEVQPDYAKTVLVVEDDPEIRRYLVAMLREDYRVIEAKDGDEGLRAIQTEHPDLVISDVMMPVMSGFQLVEAVRKLPVHADTPIILLTARNEVDSRLAGLGAGANDYVSKPFSPKELLARVETHIRIREAAQRTAESEKLAMMGLLSSSFAHEVRNPLNALLNSIGPLREQIEGNMDPQSAKTLLGIVQECGERVHGLAEALLAFARPSQQQDLVDVPGTIDATLRVYGWRMPKGIGVEKEFQCHELVRADHASLNILWLNLIDNAVRAMGDSGTLRLSTERAGEELLVIVSDTGVGVPEAVRGRIFEPFVSTRPAGEGTGLGLALCRRLVLQHGGRIQVDSVVGKGTTVSVTLPLLDRVAPSPV